jgi:hypothetical protein
MDRERESRGGVPPSRRSCVGLLQYIQLSHHEESKEVTILLPTVLSWRVARNKSGGWRGRMGKLTITTKCFLRCMVQPL